MFRYCPPGPPGQKRIERSGIFIAEKEVTEQITTSYLKGQEQSYTVMCNSTSTVGTRTRSYQIDGWWSNCICHYVVLGWSEQIETEIFSVLPLNYGPTIFTFDKHSGHGRIRTYISRLTDEVTVSTTRPKNCPLCTYLMPKPAISFSAEHYCVRITRDVKLLRILINSETGYEPVLSTLLSFGPLHTKYAKGRNLESNQEVTI